MNTNGIVTIMSNQLRISLLILSVLTVYISCYPQLNKIPSLKYNSKISSYTNINNNVHNRNDNYNSLESSMENDGEIVSLTKEQNSLLFKLIFYLQQLNRHHSTDFDSNTNQDSSENSKELIHKFSDLLINSNRHLKDNLETDQSNQKSKKDAPTKDTLLNSKR